MNLSHFQPWRIPLAFALVLGLISLHAMLIGASGRYWFAARYFRDNSLPLVARTIVGYRQAEGTYPSDLPTFVRWTWGSGQRRGVGDRDTGVILDYSGHPLVYARTGSGFTLTSYGSDGLPGGEGSDCDRMVDQANMQMPVGIPRGGVLTLGQFFDSPHGFGRWSWIYVCWPILVVIRSSMVLKQVFQPEPIGLSGTMAAITLVAMVYLTGATDAYPIGWCLIIAICVLLLSYIATKPRPGSALGSLLMQFNDDLKVDPEQLPPSPWPMVTRIKTSIILVIFSVVASLFIGATRFDTG